MIEKIVSQFRLPEGKWEAAPFGNGHINDTMKVTVHTEAGDENFILQKVNRYVFKKPEEVMSNMEKVTGYLKKIIAHQGGDPMRGTLTIIETHDGKSFTYDDDGELWRMMVLIENTVSKDMPDTPELMELCGKAFGEFQCQLADFPAAVLVETIPDFHNTPARFQQLMDAIKNDAVGRAKDVQEEIEFCMQHEKDVAVLLEACAAGEIPLRVTHNDTKLNNVLLDAETGEGVCVIDLDTVMPGLAAYDFGDAIRIGANTAAEDEQDLMKVDLDISMFEAFTRGFFMKAGSAFSKKEAALMPMGAMLMTLENGLRFLADHLNGDKYFKIHRENQNLDRARVQFMLVSCMEQKWGEMMNVIAKLYEEYGKKED
ncbi:MAG: aminoglycoside phosphotransferase family protein [Clostridia bacterium]|nr:aminoglycoside phosphotransferase family protein [Clostridia bacterium]